MHGPNVARENSPEYINDAINAGFDVEVDVWFHDGTWWLGHDAPQYVTSIEYLLLNKSKLWIHAKSHTTLTQLLKYKNDLHIFSHDTDPVVLTSRAIPWAYPGHTIDHATICVMPERVPNAYKEDQLKSCAGICSDYIYPLRICLES